MSSGDAEHEASWAACRAATLALERRLNESYHPGDADAVSTAVSAASAARTAMLRGMGEVARFEWDRQECVALLLNMRRTLQANWDSADPQKRAAMGPLCAAVAAALTHAPFAPPPEAAIIGAIDVRVCAIIFNFSNLFIYLKICKKTFRPGNALCLHRNHAQRKSQRRRLRSRLSSSSKLRRRQRRRRSSSSRADSRGR